MKILLAEDEIDLNNIVTKYLKKNGYSVESVFNGEEALDYLEYDEYDLIILDIMMPKVDGVKVLKAIRDFEVQRGILPENKVKIIIITALADTEFVNTAFDLGCEAYAAKPVDTDKLVEVMNKLGVIKVDQ